MMRVTFRPPTESDLDYIAAHMREMDRKECELIAGLPPREALAQCVEGASAPIVAEIEGAPVCIFGVNDVSFLGGDGYPWMLCAEGIERHARAVLICAPRFIAEFQRGFERLTNVVHADNRSAIRFLKWCGFSFGEVFHVKGEPFLRFEWRANNRAVAA